MEGMEGKSPLPFRSLPVKLTFHLGTKNERTGPKIDVHCLFVTITDAWYVEPT